MEFGKVRTSAFTPVSAHNILNPCILFVQGQQPQEHRREISELDVQSEEGNRAVGHQPIPEIRVHRMPAWFTTKYKTPNRNRHTVCFSAISWRTG